MPPIAPLNRTVLRIVLAVALLAVSLASCAGRQTHSGNDPLDGSGGVPDNIDYHAYPYNLRAG